MSEHTVVDLAGGLQGRCPPATTTSSKAIRSYAAASDW
jgi:hypothetical protein